MVNGLRRRRCHRLCVHELQIIIDLILNMESQPTPTNTKQSGVQPGTTQHVQWGFHIDGEYVQKETTASEAVSVDGMKARWRGILGLDGDL